MNESSSLHTPKYREVAATLREEIARGLWTPGERLPGEHDLAARFGVAYMTMRQAVAYLVEQGVLQRLRGKGTYVVDTATSAGLTIPTTRLPMALLFPADWRHNDPYYFPELFQGFQQAMVEAGGFHAPLYDYAEAGMMGSALAPGSAVACLLIDEAHLALIERLRDEGYRVLAVNRYSGRRVLPSVRIDEAGGVEAAVDHLASLGHERIAFLCGRPGNRDAAERLRGFRAATRRHDFATTPAVGDGFTEAAGYEAARELLTASSTPPTAMVCASDLSALGAIKAARDLGLSVPRDLSVVGFGDFSVAPYVSPGLTTVRQKRADLGFAAAEALLRLAQGGDAESLVLSADLIVRESTAYVSGRGSVAPALAALRA